MWMKRGCQQNDILADGYHHRPDQPFFGHRGLERRDDPVGDNQPGDLVAVDVGRQQEAGATVVVSSGDDAAEWLCVPGRKHHN